jgi:hypothetical protein
MLKCLVVLAIVGTMSVPAAAQTTPSAPATDQAQAAKPQMVKKRVCEESNDDPYSRIKTKTCKTVMVPAQPGTTASNGATSPTPAPQPNAGN